MIRINLLPHREIRRKQQQRQFTIALAVVAIAGAALAYGVYLTLSETYDNHVSRNKYLTDEIAKVDKEIAEITRLKERPPHYCRASKWWKPCKAIALKRFTCLINWCGNCRTACT